jgi:hypothetical protein
MAKIYLVRHQANGFVHEFPFAQEPSAEQLDAIKKLCFQRCGAEHPKSQEPYWVRVEERAVLGPKDIPDVPDRALSTVSSAAGMGEFTVAGAGTVTPKAGV